jgi:hypothetical protein
MDPRNSVVTAPAVLEWIEPDPKDTEIVQRAIDAHRAGRRTIAATDGEREGAL